MQPLQTNKITVLGRYPKIRKIIFYIHNPKKIISRINVALNETFRYFFENLGFDYLSKPYGIESIEYHNNLLTHFDFMDGFFIEIGAHDGFFHSPTYYLEKFKGWRGILIEPVPILFQRCKKRRTNSHAYNCAAVSSDFNEETVKIMSCGHSSHLFGTFDPETDWIKQLQTNLPENEKIIDVPARTLTSIIQEEFEKYGVSKIDLFVLDVEEAEMEVLKGLDFSCFTPQKILAESHTKELQEKIGKYLSEKGYSLVGLISSQDYLYELVRVEKNKT